MRTFTDKEIFERLEKVTNYKRSENPLIVGIQSLKDEIY